MHELTSTSKRIATTSDLPGPKRQEDSDHPVCDRFVTETGPPKPRQFLSQFCHKLRLRSMPGGEIAGACCRRRLPPISGEREASFFLTVGHAPVHSFRRHCESRDAADDVQKRLLFVTRQAAAPPDTSFCTTSSSSSLSSLSTSCNSRSRSDLWVRQLLLSCCTAGSPLLASPLQDPPNMHGCLAAPLTAVLSAVTPICRGRLACTWSQHFLTMIVMSRPQSCVVHPASRRQEPLLWGWRRLGAQELPVLAGLRGAAGARRFCWLRYGHLLQARGFVGSLRQHRGA